MNTKKQSPVRTDYSDRNDDSERCGKCSTGGIGYNTGRFFEFSGVFTVYIDF